MAVKLITKAELSRMLQVTPAAVTKMTRGPLQDTMVNTRIDMGHPVAVAFLKKWNAGSPTKIVVDELYETAVAICHNSGRCSARMLKKELHIGVGRATKIVAMIKAGGADKLVKSPPPPPPKIKPMVVPPPPPPKKPKATGVTTQVVRKKKAQQKLKTIDPEDLDESNSVPEDLRAFAHYTLQQLCDRFGNELGLLDWLKSLKLLEDVVTAQLKNAATAGDLVSVELIQLGVIDPINKTYRSLLTDGAKTIAQSVNSMTKSKATLVECELEVVQQMTSLIQSAKNKMTKAIKKI